MKYFNGNFDTRDIIAITLVLATVTIGFMGMDLKVIGTLTASVVSFYFKDLPSK
jgi:hypothetical protein